MTEFLEVIKEIMKDEYERGRIDAAQAALLSVLSTKGRISEELRQEIRRQKYYRGLMRWLEIALDMPDVDAFEDQII